VLVWIAPRSGASVREKIHKTLERKELNEQQERTEDSESCLRRSFEMGGACSCNSDIRREARQRACFLLFAISLLLSEVRAFSHPLPRHFDREASRAGQSWVIAIGGEVVGRGGVASGRDQAM